jgi:hypothetical protein
LSWSNQARRKPSRYRKVLADQIERVPKHAHFMAAVPIHSKIWLTYKRPVKGLPSQDSSHDRLGIFNEMNLIRIGSVFPRPSAG